MSEAAQRVVRDGQPLQQGIANAGVPAGEVGAFTEMLEAELNALTPYNSARYRIPLGEVQAWIERGRPQ